MSRGTDQGWAVASLAALLLVLLSGPLAAQAQDGDWNLAVADQGDGSRLTLSSESQRWVVHVDPHRSSLELLRTQGGPPLRTLLVPLSVQLGPSHDPLVLALDGSTARIHQVHEGPATGLQLTFNGTAKVNVTVWMTKAPATVGPWALDPGTVLMAANVDPPADRANVTSRLLVQAVGQGSLARNGSALWWQTGPEVARLTWDDGARTIGTRSAATNGTALLWLQQGPSERSAVFWQVGPAPAPERLEGVGDWRIYAAGAVAALVLLSVGLAATVRSGRR